MLKAQVLQIRESLENRPLSFEQCIEWARLRFQQEYNNEIRQLLFSLPLDMVSAATIWYVQTRPANYAHRKRTLACHSGQVPSERHHL